MFFRSVEQYKSHAFSLLLFAWFLGVLSTSTTSGVDCFSFLESFVCTDTFPLLAAMKALVTNFGRYWVAAAQAGGRSFHVWQALDIICGNSKIICTKGVTFSVRNSSTRGTACGVEADANKDIDEEDEYSDDVGAKRSIR